MPLHAACRQKNVDGIKLLIECGADISMKNSDGIVPYEMLLLAIDSSNCFNEAFDLKSGMNVVPNYEHVHRLLPQTKKCFPPECLRGCLWLLKYKVT